MTGRAPRRVSTGGFVALCMALSVALYQCSTSVCAPNDPICNGEGPDSGSSGGPDGGLETGLADSSMPRDSGSSGAETGAPDAYVAMLNPPVITPPGPAALVAGTTVTLAPGAGPANVQIYYTTSGSVPTPPTTGTLYAGAPIQITFAQGPTETVIAVAHDPTGAYADSPPAAAVYTQEQPEAGSLLPPVTFSQVSSTQNNDFPLGLSDTPGANICYTLDGVTTPTCTAAATCISPALTYSQILQINGTSPPNPATGSVTVTAIACVTGAPPSTPVSQTYVLQVAPPTMTLGTTPVPAGTGLVDVPWPTGHAGLTPTVSTATQSSITVSDPVALSYTTTSIPPSCTTGTSVPSPTTFDGSSASQPLLSASTTYEVIGCKQGYLPSAVVTFPFTIQLNTAVLAPSTSPYAYELDMVGTPGVLGTDIDDSANSTMAAPLTGAPAGEILCATTDGTPAACSLTAGVASCSGTGSSTPVVKSTGTTVSIVACAPGLVASKPASATYTLQLAPPFLSSTDPTGGGLGKPGWDWAGTGLPIQTMTLPAGAATSPNGYPYADGFTWNVGQVQQNAKACTGTAGAPEPTGGCGPNAYFAADYYCWTLTGTAACGPAGTCTSGTAQAVSTPGSSTAVLPGGPTGAGVTSTSTLSIVACDADGTGEDVFLPSIATNVVF
ncbi:MAG: hypothetical protein ABSE49_17075 [Polyangiaceae bacterium]